MPHHNQMGLVETDLGSAARAGTNACPFLQFLSAMGFELHFIFFFIFFFFALNYILFSSMGICSPLFKGYRL
jgi:hypothetical protein